MVKRYKELLHQSPQELSLLTGISDSKLSAFHEKLSSEGKRLYRNLAWRNIDDPYAVWISEVMLQQTQVSRVIDRWDSWLKKFPTVDALASASQSDVLLEWQGLGYNRRALNVLKTARIVSENYHGHFPHSLDDLLDLPGIGAATAGGIKAFAFNERALYLETNVRSVLLDSFFKDEYDVGDSRLYPVLAQILPTENYRSFYYALLDCGAHLKKNQSNPSRRSKHYAKQSKFEGSRRQKRAELLRFVLNAPEGIREDDLINLINEEEHKAGRERLSNKEVISILDDLVSEGFIRYENQSYTSAT
ncbi:MAG: adenine glycosylase [Coriobacteriia bacterium]|nr:adenine glycosylase [Coriobacteriia bacterium]